MTEDSPAIELLTLSTDVVAAVGDIATFARLYDVDPGPDVSLVQRAVEQNEAFRQRIAAPAAWCGHLAIDAMNRQVVGTCAFKGTPVNGVVEVAYFTFPSCEGRGYGRAMCQALVQKAAASGLVRLVTAHTLPENNASTRILAQSGFAFIGPVSDPEDGMVFLWEYAVVRPWASSG